jgi:peptide/nickel transport system substrate-binding protein
MEKRKRTTLFLIVIPITVVLLLLSGCAPATEPAPTEEPVAEAAPTEAPAPTEPPPPTEAPAPTDTPEPEIAEPKVLIVRLYEGVQTLDPAFVVGGYDSQVQSTILNRLVSYDTGPDPKEYKLYNDLVESIEQSEDGLEITFKLKEGVMWQRGYGELTAEDVKYSYERYLDEELDSPYAEDWATLDRVEVVDQYTGKIILSEPFAPLWKTTLPIDSGHIISKKFAEEVGPEGLTNDMVGTGPYILAEFEPSEKIVVERNADYFGDPPYYDEIHFIPIDDDKAAEIALEAEEVQFSRISDASIERFQDDPGYEVATFPALAYRWIGMNVENPKLEDINVREAIRHALDVDSIVQATYMGAAERAYTMVPPGLTGHWADAPRYQPDLEKAEEYMAAAGLESLDLRLDIEDETEYRTWAEIAQQNLKEIGINLEINPLDPGSFWEIGAGDEGLNVELYAISYGMGPDPSWATMWFLCDQVGVWNWNRWCNEDFDALHFRSVTTLGEEERDQIHVDMEKLVDASASFIWITHGTSAYAYMPGVGPAFTPNGEPDFHRFAGE